MSLPKFGTSGLRGLATDLVGTVARQHVSAFIAHLRANYDVRPADPIFVGRDLRASSPDIAADCFTAIEANGMRPVDCGVLPTPALALYAQRRDAAAIMVTGSHIPADRNGLKFYTPNGEIDKNDEAEIVRRIAGATPAEVNSSSPETADAMSEYVRRYSNVLKLDAFRGKRFGIFEHSSTARDHLAKLLTGFGAETFSLGRSESFVAVDTETLSPKISSRLRQWAETHQFDAILSTDGDGDRPLVIDETGRPLRGDLLGLVTALTLHPTRVVTPISTNSAIDARYDFQVQHTRIGSPYVIAAMQLLDPQELVLGFEANGGVLTATDFVLGESELESLPTRDAILPILCALDYATRQKLPLSALHEKLGLTTALSGVLGASSFDQMDSLMFNLQQNHRTITEIIAGFGEIDSVDQTDGLRCQLDTGNIVHLRPSGNAPEMRVYIEAENFDTASVLLNEIKTRIQLQFELNNSK